MSKLFTKTLSVILVAAMLFSCVIVNAVTPEENELVPSAEAYQYLWDQGFPHEVVETLSAENIMEIYNGQYELESVSTTYGIFTESDSISYEIDGSGNIVMDDNNRAQFNALLQDNAKTQKILHDKFAASTNEKSAGLAAADLSANIKTLSKDAAIRTLTNWHGYLYVNKIYELPTEIKKQIIYQWYWIYYPAYTLTDKVATAWSKAFSVYQNSITWTYRCSQVDSDGTVYYSHLFSGTGCDDVNPDCGFGKDIDIVSSYTENGTTYPVNMHSGSIKGNIIRSLIGSEQNAQNYANAVGRYYHKQFGFTGELGFSQNGPTISITHSGAYDKSPDTSVVFKFYSDR